MKRQEIKVVFIENEIKEEVNGRCFSIWEFNLGCL